jgi:hypothetical protein
MIPFPHENGVWYGFESISSQQKKGYGFGLNFEN